MYLARTLGFYGMPGAMRDPNEWSSLLITVALGAGCWAVAAKDGPLLPQKTLEFMGEYGSGGTVFKSHFVNPDAW